MEPRAGERQPGVVGGKGRRRRETWRWDSHEPRVRRWLREAGILGGVLGRSSHRGEHRIGVEMSGRSARSSRAPRGTATADAACSSLPLSALWSGLMQNLTKA